MKDIQYYINERGQAPIIDVNDPSFKNRVKYSKPDWDEWVKMWKENEFGKDILIGNYDNSKDIFLIYKLNHNQKIVDHIGTYNKDTEELYCDDIKLFGNEV